MLKVLHVHPYASLKYALTVGHIGTPLLVTPWQTHVLLRRCADGSRDAAGTYPVACLGAKADLAAGLSELSHHGAISVVLIADPISGPSPEAMQRAFPVQRRFKSHYLVNPESGAYAPTSHHRYEIRRAAKQRVEVRSAPLSNVLDDWLRLYELLVERHRIASRFSAASFSILADCVGVVTTCAYVGSEMIAGHIWIEHEGCLWSHLAASNATGYASGAAYAIYDHAIRSRPQHLIDLGGVAGASDATENGLAQFKAGFANDVRPSWLFGAVLDAARYDDLTRRAQPANPDYFPAYWG